MKTKKIYIIRHGQTDYNLNNQVQGRGIDSSLNSTGRFQAQRFFEAYEHVTFDKIYTSKLKRTAESVSGFLDKGIATTALPGLDEISWGDHEGESFDPDMHKKYLDVVKKWSEGDLDIGVEGGESPNDVMRRQRQAISEIMSNEDEETVLIATHGRAMRILICWLLNYPLTKMDAFEHANLCLYLLEHNDATFRIVKHADITHLK